MPGLIKRLRLAWRFKVWPWNVPDSAIRYLSLRPLIESDIRRTHELAMKYGWEYRDWERKK